MDEMLSCIKGSILEAWSRHVWQNGVQIDALTDFRKLTVFTQNSRYEIILICAETGEILIRGGQFFPQLTPARLSGSSMGGSFLKVRGIYLGFNLEIQHEGRSVLTSRVRTIRITEEK